MPHITGHLNGTKTEGYVSFCVIFKTITFVRLILMINKLVTVNWILAILIAVIVIGGYFSIANYVIKFGKTGYYEGLEGYSFILVFASPILVAQLLLAIILIAKKVKPRQAQLSLLPLIFATLIPFGVAVVIG